MTVELPGEPMRACYERDGYLLLRNVIAPAVLDALCARIDRQIDDYGAELQRRGKVSELYADLPFARRLAALLHGTGIRLRKWNDFLFGPEIYALVTSPDLLAALSAILGPEVTFHGDYQLTPKLPDNTLQAFPWHQDTLYYGRPTADLHIVTAWVPLVEATELNGCLQVIPGSHRWGLLDGVRDTDMNVHPLEDVTARGAPIAIPMRPGDVLLMTNLTFHASAVNRSEEVRWSLDLGFSATPAQGGASARLRAAQDYLYTALRNGARTPLRIASTNPAQIESFADWERRHQAA